jgi:hypothetical protein
MRPYPPGVCVPPMVRIGSSGRPGIVGQGQNLPVYAGEQRGFRRSVASASNSFCADCLISREYLTTRAGALQACCAVLLVRNALFLPARLRNQTVPEVFPYGSVFFQIDENTDLAAPLVGDKLDSTHGPIVFHVALGSRPSCTRERQANARIAIFANPDILNFRITG